MKKHKYVIYAKVDFTDFLGDLGKFMIPELSLKSDNTPLVSITSDIKFDEDQMKVILTQYREGMSKVKVKDMSLIVTKIEYEGEVEVPLDKPEEVNILNSL